MSLHPPINPPDEIESKEEHDATIEAEFKEAMSRICIDFFICKHAIIQQMDESMTFVEDSHVCEYDVVAEVIDNMAFSDKTYGNIVPNHEPDGVSDLLGLSMMVYADDFIDDDVKIENPDYDYIDEVRCDLRYIMHTQMDEL